MVGGALLHVVLVAWVVWNRIDYPYELEWIEGSSADTVQRVLEGKSIYVAPSLEFTPYLYTPMYFWLSALCAQFTGMSLVPLRVVSVLATVGCLALIFLFVRRETRSWLCAVLAAALYVGCFKPSGYWFDIGRVDSLFVFFTMASIYLLRGARGAWSLAWAAVLMTLAFLTKQSALFLAAPLALYALLAGAGRSRLVFPGVLAGLVGVSVWVLSLLSDGWFFYYVFDMHAGTRGRGSTWSDSGPRTSCVTCPSPLGSACSGWCRTRRITGRATGCSSRCWWWDCSAVPGCRGSTPAALRTW